MFSNTVYTSICGDAWHGGNKNNLRTIEAQIVQKFKNNEARPKFTGSYFKKACNRLTQESSLSQKFSHAVGTQGWNTVMSGWSIRFWRKDRLKELQERFHMIVPIAWQNILR